LLDVVHPEGKGKKRPGSKQFLDEPMISAMATHYQANLGDLSAKIHTAKRLLHRKKISAVGSDTEPAAMDSTLQVIKTYLRNRMNDD